MNIVEKVQAISDRIATVKAGFKSALEDKGVTVASDFKLKDYPELVKTIQVGGNADLTNLIPENIKSGVTINGITGTLEQGAEVVVSETEPANPTEGMIWIVVTDSSGGGTDEPSDGGSTSNADYIVSGSSTAEVNGDYVNTGNTVNGYPSYANGKGYYILYTPNYGGMWQITNDTSASGAPKHSVMSSSALPPTEGWSGVTVTKG